MHKLVILSGDNEYLNELRKAFSSDGDFEICGVSKDGNEGINLVKSYEPEAVLCDVVLLGMDGLGVLRYITKNIPSCSVFMVSEFIDSAAVSHARSAGAKYYFSKSVALQGMVNTVKSLLAEENDSPRIIDEAKVDKIISKIFLVIGIPANILGYQYLKVAIKLSVAEPTIINSITKRLYPEVAKRFKTSASRVERAIRHAIEVAWNKGRADAINSVFGAKVYSPNERPTNSEFIALMTEKIILDSLE